MLNIHLLDKEVILLEKHNILISFKNSEKFYDVILTNQRLLIYLNNFEYDPPASIPSISISGKPMFKDCWLEIFKNDIVNKKNNIISLKNNQKLEIKDEEIIKNI